MLELGRRPQGGELPLVQHGDAIARLGLLDIVCGQEHGEAGRGTQAADPLPQRAAPARGSQQCREQVNGGGLPGAVRPEQPEELSRPDLEIEPIERADRAEVFAEAAGVDRGGGHPFAASPVPSRNGASARDAGAARYVHSTTPAALSTAATAASIRWRCGDNEHTGSVRPATPAP